MSLSSFSNDLHQSLYTVLLKETQELQELNGLKWMRKGHQELANASKALKTNSLSFEINPHHFNNPEISLPLSNCSQMLFDLISNLDELPPIQQEWQADHSRIATIINNPSLNDAQITDQLLALKDSPCVTRALLYAALCDEEFERRLKAFYWLTLTVVDDYKCFSWEITRLIQEGFPRLKLQVRERIIWLFRCAVEQEIPESSEIGYCLLRCIKPASIAPEDVALSLDLLMIFQKHKQWLYKFPLLVASCCYVFLRLIPEHAQIAHLSDMEIEFVLMILREQFLHCLKLGRDLVRSLMAVSRIEQFDEFLKLLLTEPQKLNSNLQSILQVLSIPPNKRVIAARLTIEMERKLYFMMEKVRLGSQKYYQSWFSSLYIQGKGASSATLIAGEMMIPDLIRFILYAFGEEFSLPLKSAFVPRWAMIGWLLKCCKSYTTASACKMSLFLDWFFFEPQNGDVLAVLEPAFSFLLNSTRKYPKITNSLVEFIFLFRKDFFSQFASVMEKKLHLSIDALLRENAQLAEDFVVVGKSLQPSVMEMFCQVFGQNIQLEELKNQASFLMMANNNEGEEDGELEDEKDSPNKQEENDESLSTLINDTDLEVESADDKAASKDSSFDSPVDFLSFELGKFFKLEYSDLEEFLQNPHVFFNWLKGENAVFEGYLERIVEKLAELLALEVSLLSLNEISQMKIALFVTKFGLKNYIADFEDSTVTKRLDLLFGHRLFTAFPTYRTILLCILAAYHPNDVDFEQAKENFLFTNGSEEQWIHALLHVKIMNIDYFYGMIHMFFSAFPFFLSGNLIFWRGIMQDADPNHFLTLKLSLCSLQSICISSSQQMANLLAASLEWESWEQIFTWSLLSPLIATCCDDAFFIETLNGFLERFHWIEHSEASCGLFTLLSDHLREDVPFEILEKILLWPQEDQWLHSVQKWIVSLFDRLISISFSRSRIQDWLFQFIELVQSVSFEVREFVSGRVAFLLSRIKLEEDLIEMLEGRIRDVALDGNASFEQLVASFYDGVV